MPSKKQDETEIVSSFVNAAYGSTARYAGATSLGDHVANFHNEDSTGSVLQSIVK